MKKLLAFLVLALGLVACGQKETPAPVAEQPAAEQAAEAVDGAKTETTEATTEAKDGAVEEAKDAATEAVDKVAEEAKPKN